MSTEIQAASASLRRAIQTASSGLIERETLVELIALAAVAEEHLLIVGPPGTAKSEAVRRMSRTLGGRYFEYLLGRFTEPSELFGPVDLRKLKDGIVETETTGMLPEAELAFLDEVFLGSTAILNTLLGILNERTFRRGHTKIRCPLRICVGATNDLPQDDTLSAFADRFLLRFFVEPIADPLLEELLAGGWSLKNAGQDAEPMGLQHLDILTQAARSASVDEVRDSLAHAIRTIRSAGVALSDRRAVKTQRLIAAAAALAGRQHPTEADLWPLIYAVPTQEGQKLVRDSLRELLESSENPTLPSAAEQASRGPVARAARLVESAQSLLQTPPAEGQAQRAWQLKLEGIAREIDAGFTPETLPESLAQVRAQIVERIQRSP